MRKLAAILTILSAALLGPAAAQHDHSNHGASNSAPAEIPQATDGRVGDPWPLDTCVVSGGKLGSMGEPIIRLHEGREVRFCCAGCIPKFEADPAVYLQKADQKIKEQQKASYPLTYCIIDTQESLSAEDESKNAYSVVGNRLFVYCCPPCDEKVRLDPAKYIKVLNDAAIQQQKPTYPLNTCVISGQPLDAMGGAVDRVIAGQLVRLCCAGCDDKLLANPTAALSRISEARQAAAAATQPE